MLGDQLSDQKYSPDIIVLFIIALFFVHCIIFLNHYNFKNIEKKNDNFGITGQPGPNGILKLKIFWKKKH